MNYLGKCVNTLKFGLKTFNNVRTLMISQNLNIKVALCGAHGGVGQATALLLKMSPLINELVLYDIVSSNGVRADASHINTNSKVTCFEKSESLPKALSGANIIVLSAGLPRKPGMSRADLFSSNANIVKEVAEVMAKAAPNAMLCVITNPVNSVVPVAAQVLEKAKVYDPRRLFGVTTLDCVRASAFAAQLLCLDAAKLIVPVVGGHAGATIVPLFSQASSKIDIPKDKWKALVERVQNGGTEVVKAKAGGGSATLSMGFAAARFTFALCRALKGEGNIVECSMVQSDVTDAKFFSTPLLLNCQGIEKNLGIGKVTDDECELINKAVKQLIEDVEMGEKFAKESDCDKKKETCDKPKK